jgi:uncharacterized protein YjiS (DUF1127 family)
MRSDIHRRLAPAPRSRLRAAVGRTVTAHVLRLRWAWRRRRELRRLAEFDDRMPCDIGLSRGDVERALARPFRHDVEAERRRRRPCSRS